MQCLVKILRFSSLIFAFHVFSLNYLFAQVCANTDVTTLAGMAGVKGSVDGNGIGASFHFPFGMTSDAAGNIYVTDRGNNTIRKITPNGNVTTIAGTPGIVGFADGMGSAAKFSTPTAITAADDGTLYVSDRSNYRIRKITSAGVVTTLAGLGIRGSDDGMGIAATFEFPTAITMGVDGNLYVADGSTVRKITPAGAVTTIAGQFGDRQLLDGTGTAARFTFVHGITSDPFGNLYISEFGTPVIRKITSGGVVSTIAGGPRATNEGYVDGIGSAVKLNFPTGLASDGQGNIYISEQSNDLIRKMTPAGVVSTFAGVLLGDGAMNGSADQATFQNPTAIGIDGFGNVYVSDVGEDSQLVRKIGDCANPAAVTISFAPVSDSNPLNCADNGEQYFASTLRIPETGSLQSGLDFRVFTATDFFTGVPCGSSPLQSGGAVGRFSGLMTPDLGLGGAEIKETRPGSGVYQIQFWTRNAAATKVTVVESNKVSGPTAAALTSLANVTIPTMNQWGLLIFGLLLLNLGIVFIYQKQSRLS